MNYNKESKRMVNPFKESYFSCFNSSNSVSTALLPTALIRLELDTLSIGPIRALIDTGSQVNLVSAVVLRQLKGYPQQRKTNIVGINGDMLVVKEAPGLNIRPWFESDFVVKEQFWVVSESQSWQPSMPLMKMKELNGRNLQPLADPQYGSRGETHALLGVNVIAKIIQSVLPNEKDHSLLLGTSLGTIILGPHEVNSGATDQLVATAKNIDEILDTQLQRLWQLDEVKERKLRTPEEETVEKHFMQTYRRGSNGRFTVSMPMKNNVENIGSSREIALKRFYLLEKRLEKEPDLKKKYIEFMQEYESLGHMQLVNDSRRKPKVVYHIPHHCVKEKFRVVFDASCKTNKGISLNEVQMLGENLQRDLHEIVMRFRRHKIAIVADIKMMFRQVAIAREQWDLQRIFWRENSEKELKEYWLTVNTYGMTSAAHNAVRAMVQCAEEAKDNFPLASYVIQNDMYMDDLTTGAESEKEALNLAKDIDFVLKGAQFELRKWKSNCRELRKIMKGSDSNIVQFDEDENEKVLGLLWMVNTDQFTYAVKTPQINGNLTKRKIVSCVAQLYDPNGFVAPVVILGKILIRDIWRLSINWDDKVPDEIEKDWKELWDSIMWLEYFKIDRWLATNNNERIEIHGFSDASSKAYGAVIYVRKICKDGKGSCSLLVAKTRVAPLKTITIPRLELAAAELLSRVLVEVLSAMEWKDVTYTLWTNSAVVLHWLQKIPRSLKTYVANRVSSIQSNTSIKRWRHVGTKDNPADLLSRGVNAKDLVNSCLWRNGPSWLALPPSEWPSNTLVPIVSDAGRQEMKVVNAAWKINEPLGLYSPGKKEVIPILEYAGRIEKAVSILAIVIKFCRMVKESRCRRQSKRGARIMATTNIERAEAMRHLVKEAQRKDFGKDIRSLEKDGKLLDNSRLEPLRPILDENGLLRVGGRLERSDLEYDAKHPIIVPNGSRLAWLIVDQAHRYTKHGANQVMMQYIRQRYWILRMRNELRKYIHRCVVCARYEKKLGVQLLADLPRERVTCGKPFLVAGVDFAGPFKIKIVNRQGKELSRDKIWIAVFVCFKTRAIHLDIVIGLTTVAFIACFERFVARRGRCERIYSDNGTTFKGAERELKAALKKWTEKDVIDHLGAKGTEWKFMAPAAPHQGGIYEAAVKSMKHHLIRVVGMQVLTYDQLQTLLTGVEAILNSRPLYPLSQDVRDMQALTPGHFLVGEPLVLPLPFCIQEQSKEHGVALWKERKKMLEGFWKRWQGEYLTSLQERKKWRRERDPLRIGQLVVLKSENHPPAVWALGRIVELMPGTDGRVRTVKVRTENSELIRPVQKL